MDQNLSVKNTVQSHGPKPVSQKYNTGSWTKTCQSKIQSRVMIQNMSVNIRILRHGAKSLSKQHNASENIY